jgi:hypothetical protein
VLAKIRHVNVLTLYGYSRDYSAKSGVGHEYLVSELAAASLDSLLPSLRAGGLTAPKCSPGGLTAPTRAVGVVEVVADSSDRVLGTRSIHLLTRVSFTFTLYTLGLHWVANHHR